MRTRILPREEWSKLEQTPQPVRSDMFPRDVSVVVVEDGEKIVARMFVMKIPHFEGVWIDPGYKQTALSLLRQSFGVVEEPWVMAGAADSRMDDILERMGAVKIPAQFYTLGVGV